MAGNPLKRVAPGQVLPSIPVEAYNAMIDLVNRSRASSFNVNERGESWSRKYSTITIRNSSGIDIPRWGILQPLSPLVRPIDNEAGFFEVVGMEGSVPGSASSPFCVLLQPLQPDEIGLGVVAGVTPALVTMQDESHTWCSPEPDEHGSLYSGEYGQARILWVEPAPSGSPSEPRRAYVLLWSVPDIGSVSGSDAWVTCKKRITDIRCTDDGWEYDAEFEYISADGRILFTSDTPCPGMDGGEDPGGGGEDDIPTVCCPGGIPETLTASIVDEGNCECLSGAEVTLTHSISFDLHWWEGSVAVTCGEEEKTLTVSMWCNTFVPQQSNPDYGKIGYRVSCGGAETADAHSDPSCGPFALSASGLSFVGAGKCCVGTIGLLIS